jgi:DDE superfamily endonuclease
LRFEDTPSWQVPGGARRPLEPVFPSGGLGAACPARRSESGTRPGIYPAVGLHPQSHRTINPTGVVPLGPLGARPRFHVHYTPTYSSWLNQVEIWFNIITQRAIRRGTFRSVRDLRQKIDGFVNRYNRNSQPFAWTATPDSILEKLERLSQAIAGTAH